MAKVILEHKLKDWAKSEQFTVISAACYNPTNSETSLNARETIKTLYKQDLLATHKSKSLTPELTEKADLILVMTDAMKNGLPPNKTYSVKEYGGQAGDVMDPFGGQCNDRALIPGDTKHGVKTSISNLLKFHCCLCFYTLLDCILNHLLCM